MKPFLIRTGISAALLLLAASIPISMANAAQNRITPGQGIGQVRLGEDIEAVLSHLGKPDSSDAAMGHAWDTWFSTHRGERGGSEGVFAYPPQLNVYSGLDFSTQPERRQVKQIRVTSPTFTTSTGLSTHSRLSLIRRAYRTVRVVGHYYSRRIHHRVDVYDAKSAGIAFEVEHTASGSPNSGQCLAITVHPRNRSVTAIYLPLDAGPEPSR